MNIVYKEYVFPFKETNLERIIDGKYFRINLHDESKEIKVMLENELMLLEFSKSLKATASLFQDYEKEPYIIINIDLEIFVSEFNARYKLNAVVESE